ncbi:excalibur calcium-binding domain-containing protein [Brevibacillus marinus]|uniref:excalibur calcium-binding domain-containing protein n=1 Tax=Brevibacillus marinus TaxID=2496837 RepID=UPI0019D179E5
MPARGGTAKTDVPACSEEIAWQGRTPPPLRSSEAKALLPSWEGLFHFVYLYQGKPGYRPALDRDGDGIACE